MQPPVQAAALRSSGRQLSHDAWPQQAAHLSRCLRLQGYAVVDADPATAALVAQAAASTAHWLLSMGHEERQDLDIDAGAALSMEGRLQLGCVFDAAASGGGGGVGLQLHMAHKRLFGVPDGVDALAAAVSGPARGRARRAAQALWHCNGSCCSCSSTACVCLAAVLSGSRLPWPLRRGATPLT